MKNPNDPNEDKIEILFRELKKAEEGSAPSFLELWQPAVSGVRASKKYRPVLGFAAAALTAILLISVLLIFGNHRPSEARYTLPSSISQWKSPTDFLMQPTAQPWLNTMPQFGGSLETTQTGSSGNQE